MALQATQTLFSVGLLSGGLLLGGLLATIVSPTFRFWPHGTRNWTFWVSWTAWTLYVVGLVGIAYLDWWHWYEPPVVVQLVSVLVFVAGTALSIWAMWTLGFWESSGLEGHLQTEGPYRFSRNPQYVGFIAMLASGGLLAGSIQTVILAIGGIVWFLLAPLAEEPWLREQYGDAYEEYLRSVPRFLGRTHREPPQQEQTDRTKGGNQ